MWAIWENIYNSSIPVFVPHRKYNCHLKCKSKTFFFCQVWRLVGGSTSRELGILLQRFFGCLRYFFCLRYFLQHLHIFFNHYDIFVYEYVSGYIRCVYDIQCIQVWRQAGFPLGDNCNCCDHDLHTSPGETEHRVGNTHDQCYPHLNMWHEHKHKHDQCYPHLLLDIYDQCLYHASDSWSASRTVSLRGSFVSNTCYPPTSYS